MIFAGPCLITDKNELDKVLKTALSLKDYITHFRVKIWGGGTTPDKYQAGLGKRGLFSLENINVLMPTGTEVQTPEQIELCKYLGYIWIGARNSQNYSLLEKASEFKGDVLLKRSAGMTIDEVIGLYDIMNIRNGKKVYIIERGLNTFDRKDNSRWSPDLKGVIRIKHERPDIFERLVVDCSHSVGLKRYVQDTYNAFKKIGVKHFMFESTTDGVSKTDQNHMLSTEGLKGILESYDKEVN